MGTGRRAPLGQRGAPCHPARAPSAAGQYVAPARWPKRPALGPFCCPGAAASCCGAASPAAPGAFRFFGGISGRAGPPARLGLLGPLRPELRRFAPGVAGIRVWGGALARVRAAPGFPGPISEVRAYPSGGGLDPGPDQCILPMSAPPKTQTMLCDRSSGLLDSRLGCCPVPGARRGLPRKSVSGPNLQSHLGPSDTRLSGESAARGLRQPPPSFRSAARPQG
jgi:hypothetical protein